MARKSSSWQAVLLIEGGDLGLQKRTHLLFANNLEDCFAVEEPALSIATNAWQHQIEKIEICCKEIVLSAIIINGTVGQGMG
jgi:hypothetical protein